MSDTINGTGSTGTAETADHGEASSAVQRPDPLRLGFVRGVTPAKWARRWKAATPGHRLELVALEASYGSPLDAANPRLAQAAAACDVLIERTATDQRPSGTVDAGGDPGSRTRHAIRLYTESIALVVPADHELAEQDSVTVAELEFVHLLDHPDHDARWPAAQPWADPEWMPQTPQAALALVAAGTGGMLLPVPLARHLVNKREHAVLPVRPAPGEPLIEGAHVWAVWQVERDDATVQHLAGILRGRTANSSRESQSERASRAPQAGGASDGRAKSQAQSKKAAPKLKPGSRGAQLAAAREKAERAKALKRQAKKKR